MGKSKLRQGIAVVVVAFSTLLTAAARTLVGAAVGARGGAPVDAAASYGAEKGTLIGVGMGGGAAALYDITR